MLPHLIYSPDYDIHAFGLENLHPFDTRKYSRAYEELRSSLGEIIERQTVRVETPVGDELLQRVHTRGYLEQLKKPDYLARALEVPFLAGLPFALIEARVLQPMRLATQGTVLAARHALQDGAAINLSGGYHHASADRGEGFCLFADIAVAIADLRATGELKKDDRVLIVDLDAHQGNGLERVFMDDPRVAFVDVYNRDIYPNDRPAKARIDFDVPLPSGTSDEAYLKAVRDVLPAAIRQVQPRLTFYNAGTDIYEGDALGNFKVSGVGVLERDGFVFQTLRAFGAPWVMVPSGGYSPQSYHLIANAVKLLFEA